MPSVPSMEQAYSQDVVIAVNTDGSASEAEGDGIANGTGKKTKRGSAPKRASVMKEKEAKKWTTQEELDYQYKLEEMAMRQKKNNYL